MKQAFLATLMVLAVMFSLQATFAQCNCCSEQYRQFDFWIGEWKVSANGNPAGTNTISVIQDSCVLVENWVSANGTFTGTSVNYYSNDDEKWHQLWLDNQGGRLDISGGIENGIMVMRSIPEVDSTANSTWHEITWTPMQDGSVRQVWIQYTAGGEGQNTLFDGLYTRKE